MDVTCSTLKGVTQDSRLVQQGYLFAAIKGEVSDGHAYIKQAIENGASVILAEHDIDVPPNVQLIVSQNIRSDLAHIAAKFYGPFPDHIIAVTGTNGKSSVVNLVQQIWQTLGYKAASIGTLTGALTSPDPVTLAQNLARLYQDGITHVALEASSHGLQQKRMDGVSFAAAGFTNLSHDHLDYHETMEAYLAAKARLFAMPIPAILNADIPEFTQLKNAAKGDVFDYGRNATAIKLISLSPHSAGSNVELEIMGQPYSIALPLIGEFQVYNAMCALGLSFMSSSPSKQLIERSVQALSALKPVKGRLQPVENHPEGAEVYIDFAHTPDALRAVLSALRPHTKSQLFCVFGCGGDRDKAKRPVMGRIASELADIIIITDDNPRFEKAVDIRNQILGGIPQIRHNENVFEISDRTAAINHSIKKLKKGDVLVIAGKGHESGQILGNTTLPFDDYDVAQKAIEGLSE